jgi:hypothetical protein
MVGFNVDIKKEVRDIALRIIRELNENIPNMIPYNLLVLGKTDILYKEFTDELIKRSKRAQIDLSYISKKELQDIILHIFFKKLRKYHLLPVYTHQKLKLGIREKLSNLVNAGEMKERDREKIKQIVFSENNEEELNRKILNYISLIRKREGILPEEKRAYQGEKHITNEIITLKELFKKKKSIAIEYFSSIFLASLYGKEISYEEIKEKYKEYIEDLDIKDFFSEDNVVRTERLAKIYSKIVDIVNYRAISDKMEIEEGKKLLEKNIRKRYEKYSFLFIDLLGNNFFDDFIKEVLKIYEAKREAYEELMEVLENEFKIALKVKKVGELLFSENENFKILSLKYPKLCVYLQEDILDKSLWFEALKEAENRLKLSEETVLGLFHYIDPTRFDERLEIEDSNIKELFNTIANIRSLKAKKMFIRKILDDKKPFTYKLFFIKLEGLIEELEEILERIPHQEVCDVKNKELLLILEYIHDYFISTIKEKRINLGKIFIFEEKILILNLLAEIIKTKKGKKKITMIKKAIESKIHKEVKNVEKLFLEASNNEKD